MDNKGTLIKKTLDTLAVYQSNLAAAMQELAAMIDEKIAPPTPVKEDAADGGERRETTAVCPTRPTSPVVHYDNNPGSPTYDPAPPFVVEPVPPRPATPAEKILVAKDAILVCYVCKKPVLQAIRNIDGSSEKGKGLSLAAFKFLQPGAAWNENGTPLFTEPTGKAINCPLCKGSKGLWLVGAPPAEAGGSL